MTAAAKISIVAKKADRSKVALPETSAEVAALQAAVRDVVAANPDLKVLKIQIGDPLPDAKRGGRIGATAKNPQG